VPTFDLRPVCNAHQLEDTPLRESAPTDPLCAIVDCLKHPLRHLPDTMYAFPPPKILTQLLAKVREEQVTVLLVCVAWKRTFLPLLGEMLVSAPLMIPWTPATVMDPHHDYRPQEAQEEARLNDQEAWSRWLLCGCVISGDTAVRKEFKTRSRATSLMTWLDCQPLLQYTSDGALIAKGYEWITLLHQLVQSSTH
jgi:hypothetical protein